MPEAQLEVDISMPLKAFTLDVAFRAGRRPLAILGASGSGKSMTLGAIAGIVRPQRGRVALNDRVLFDSENGINLPSRKRKVGFLLQDYALFPHMTVVENIAFGLGSGTDGTARRRVEEQIERMGLEGLERRLPRELSGGERQRVALARALATEPEALLLDEPLSALDVHLRSRIERLLFDALGSFSGVSLYVTHNLEEAYRISEEIVVIAEGKRVAFGPKEEIFRRPRKYVVAQVTGCKNFSRARPASDGAVEALDWGCRLAVSEPLLAVRAIGIRAHHLVLGASPDPVNMLPCRVVGATEGPFRTTIYLRLDLPQALPRAFHLQAEVSNETWAQLREHALPGFVFLHPERIMPLEEAPF